jgi:hypothetical protein
MPVTTHIGHAAPVAAPALGGPADPRGRSLLRLWRFERRWLVRVFETVLPAEPALSAGAAAAPMGRFVDDFVGRAPLPAVLGLRLALWLLMLAPLAGGRFRTFLGLSPDERLALLDRLRRSDRYLVREAAVLFKVVGCLGFCGLAQVQRRIGIFPVDEAPPPWTGR